MTRVRTRFAPSPTGPLHIGGVRTALYSYLFAKKHGGDFILRIEDTDTARTVKGSEDIINESLNWCGITPDEGVIQGGLFAPYKQSERKSIYLEYAQKLIDNGSAYYAFDSEEEISAWREKTSAENNGISQAYNYSTRVNMRNSLTLSASEIDELIANNTPKVIRLKVNPEDDVTFTDIIRDDVTFKSVQLDDRVLLKSDGMPTYHLANVVDDHLMEISHVIRGEEWLASTPHHILLYKAFGWTDTMPKFAHLPLFLKPDGNGKLSKRDGDKLGFPIFCTQFNNQDTGEITDGFREKGFERDAFVNFIAMLGWNDGSERELFGMKNLIEHFALERVQKAGAKFNFEKAKWFNQEYIKLMSYESMAEYLSKELPDLDSNFVLKYCELYRERIEYMYQLKDVGIYLYQNIKEYDTDTLKKKWNDQVASFIANYSIELTNQSFNSAEELENFTKHQIESNGLGLGAVLPVLRIALTGTTKGPSIFDTMMILGKEKSLERISSVSTIS